MTQKNADKTRARQLQKRTGWSYQRCFRLAQTLDDEAIEMRVQMETKANEQSQHVHEEFLVKAAKSMTFDDLLGYAEIHCRTELALVSTSISINSTCSQDEYRTLISANVRSGTLVPTSLIRW